MKQCGGSASLPKEFFAPASIFPTINGPLAGILNQAPSTDATSSSIRPALLQSGGSKRNTRKQRGGFSPGIMGPFMENVERLAAPVALYLAYKMLQTVKGKSKNKTKSKTFKGKKTFFKKTR